MQTEGCTGESREKKLKKQLLLALRILLKIQKSETTYGEQLKRVIQVINDFVFYDFKSEGFEREPLEDLITNREILA